jgi:hypothetical protein
MLFGGGGRVIVEHNVSTKGAVVTWSVGLKLAFLWEENKGGWKLAGRA